MKYSTSLFGQILQKIGTEVFFRCVRRTGAHRNVKGFSSWDQFVAMLFCQLAQCKSLREITDGMRVTCGKLNHLGLRESPARSTLSYANAHRPWELFQDVFFELLETCRAQTPGKKPAFRFKNKLLSLDATVIDLCLTLFPWASFRQTKGAVKLHLLLDHDGYLPAFAAITDGKTHEINIARQIELPRGSIVAIDRGYYDFELFRDWTARGVWFVTRLKAGAGYDVVESYETPERSNILFDQLIRFTGTVTSRKYPGNLRRVVVWDDAGQRQIELLTNHLDFGPTTIARIYRDRWEIELFFKCLKQNLKVKTFVGTSENALKTQIWTALIAMLLIKYLQFCSKANLALCRLVALLRLNLFSYRNLQDWLDDPFQTPAEHPPEQLEFMFGTASAASGA